LGCHNELSISVSEALRASTEIHPASSQPDSD
jgi:hypothetical protein